MLRVIPRILHMPMTMARVMLTMDRWPLFRDRAMRALASEPAIFSRLLGVHMGEESLPRFVYEKGLHLGWRILAPACGRHLNSLLPVESIKEDA